MTNVGVQNAENIVLQTKDNDCNDCCWIPSTKKIERRSTGRRSQDFNSGCFGQGARPHHHGPLNLRPAWTALWEGAIFPLAPACCRTYSIGATINKREAQTVLSPELQTAGVLAYPSTFRLQPDLPGVFRRHESPRCSWTWCCDSWLRICAQALKACGRLATVGLVGFHDFAFDKPHLSNHQQFLADLHLRTVLYSTTNNVSWGLESQNTWMAGFKSSLKGLRS